MGWDRAAMKSASATTDPKGRPYENLCIGCDRFFEAKLGPALREARERRLAARGLSRSPRAEAPAAE